MSGKLDFINTLLIVIGWVVIYKQHKLFEDRKEIKNIIDDIKSRIESTVDSATSLHQTSWCNKESEKITGDLDEIIQLSRLVASNLGSNINKECIALRQSITLNNFDKTSHKSLGIDDPLIIKIVQSASYTNYKLNDMFISKHLLKKEWWRVF